MSIVVRSMEEHEANPEYLEYSNLKTRIVQLAARVAKQGRRELATSLAGWADKAPKYTGPRMKEKGD